MTSPAPVVSVVVPCYDKAPYVAESLDSVAAQTFADLELVIVDDASTDGSLEIVRAWIEAATAARPDLAVRLLEHPRNRGVSAALNTALDAAHGRYVAILAADDLMDPDRLAFQVELLESRPERVGVLYNDIRRVDPAGHDLGSTFLDSTIPTCEGLDEPPTGDLFPALMRYSFLPATGTLVRRRCFDVVGLFDEGLPYEDHDMWLRISREFDFEYSPRVVGSWRVDPSSLSHQTDAHTWATTSIRMLRKHVGHPRYDDFLRDRIAASALRLYREGYEGDDLVELLWLRTRLRPSPGAVVHTAAARAGVSFASVARARNALSPRARRARRDRDLDA